jgi:hypothetical protein
MFQNSNMEISAFNVETTPVIEGDRFINFRGSGDEDTNDIAQKFNTKIELFEIDHDLMEEQRKNNQLVCDHQKQESTLQEIENKRTYMTLLQN